ncbi:Jmjd7 [Symbiodinium microadriaticum]|nr:Jmjd7 [Symbiodinium microadriaticum]
MKHAVQRRICEGSDKLEDLANAARKALGIEPLPERHSTAEAQLARGADETAAKFSGDADMQKQLRDQCLKWPGFSMSLVSNCLFVALLAWDFRGQK